MTTMQTAGPAYGITFNTTTKHYLRTDSNRRTLCGANSVTVLTDSDPQGASILWHRPLCTRCEKSAPKRGYLTADRIDWSDPDRKLKVEA